jgi:hypothetical protein
MDLEEVVAVVVRLLMDRNLTETESEHEKQVLDEFMAEHDHAKRPAKAKAEATGVSALSDGAQAEIKEAHAAEARGKK